MGLVTPKLVIFTIVKSLFWIEASIKYFVPFENRCTGRGLTLLQIDDISPGRIHVLIQVSVREFKKCPYHHTRHTP